MNRKRLLPVALIVIATAGFLAYRRWSGDAVKDGQLLLHGNIELTEVDLSFKASGRLTDFTLQEGDKVRKGQLIATLDRTEVERQKDREEASRDAATSALVQLNTSIEYQRSAIESDTALRKAELEQAQARLKELESGSRPQEVRQAQAASEESAKQHWIAQRDWERAQKLYKNEDISTAQYDQFRTRFESTQAALNRSQQNLSLVQEGPRQEQIDQARAQVSRARAALSFSEAARIDLKRRQQETSARQADIHRAEAQVAVLETQLNDRSLVSPIDGVVLTKSAENGEILAAGAAVVTIGDLASPWVRAYIGERDLGRVKTGMSAAVSSDSFPGKTYNGKVSYIASQAEFTPKSIQTEEERVKLVYKIKILVDNPNGELKLNMPVDAILNLQ